MAVKTKTYRDALTDAMTRLSQVEGSIFLGQAVAENGTAMSATFAGVPKEKLVEFPVAEDMQLGVAIGLALAGNLPICIFPRWSFLLLAANQLVHHLDKLPLYSGFRPKVIIRTAVPTPKPLDPGPQHLGDFTSAFRLILKTVNVIRLWEPKEIGPHYQAALLHDHSIILVEYTERYDDEL